MKKRSTVTIDKSLCRLCQKNAPNMKAHIMAEGLMKLIHGQPKYDGRFIMIGSEIKHPISRPTGSYDNTILCAECDNKLGVYDNVAINFCKYKDLKRHPSDAAYIISGFSQPKLKLFALSYIWRASITELKDYRGISLGDAHEAKIRDTLLNDDCGNIDDYSVLVSKFNLPTEKEKWGMHVLGPVMGRLQDVNTIEVYLPNLYKLKVKIDQRSFPDNLSSFGLNAQQDIIIFDMGDYVGSDEFAIIHKAILASK